MGWMGGSSGPSQTTTNTLSPQAAGAQQTALNFGNWAATQPFQQYGGAWSAATNPNLAQAGGMLMNSANVGGGLINEGAAGARGAMGYNPQYVGATSVQSQDTRAGQVQTGNVRPQYTQAQATGAYGGDQFASKYFSPFLSQVAGGMVDESNRGRNLQVMGDEDKALAAGAYGGSRHGVMDALTTRSYNDTLQKNVGSLLNTGFQSAVGYGMQDAQRFTDVDRANADRFLTNDQGNVNRALQADTGNMDRWVGVQTGNMNRNLQSDVGNADRRVGVDTGNANRYLSADQFNSTAGLNAAQLRLSGSQALAGMGDMQHDNYLGSAQGALQFGQTAQALDQQRIENEKARFNEWRDYPMRQSQIANNTAAAMQGGSTSTQSSNPGTLGTIGQLLGTAGMATMLFSDENIKSDVRKLGSDDAVLKGIKKTPVSTWRYDPKKGGPNDGGKQHIGPMAQDVKRNLGIGDGHQMPAVDVMGAHHAAIRSLAKKVDNITDVKVKKITKKKGGK
jgi:hypothetical protein